MISPADQKKYHLYIANKVILQEKFEVLESYKNSLEDYYDASIYLADFQNHGKGAIQYINQWVKTQTNNLIE